MGLVTPFPYGCQGKVTLHVTYDIPHQGDVGLITPGCCRCDDVLNSIVCSIGSAMADDVRVIYNLLCRVTKNITLVCKGD